MPEKQYVTSDEQNKIKTFLHHRGPQRDALVSFFQTGITLVRRKGRVETS